MVSTMTSISIPQLLYQFDAIRKRRHKTISRIEVSMVGRSRSTIRERTRRGLDWGTRERGTIYGNEGWSSWPGRAIVDSVGTCLPEYESVCLAGDVEFHCDDEVAQTRCSGYRVGLWLILTLLSKCYLSRKYRLTSYPRWACLVF